MERSRPKTDNILLRISISSCSQNTFLFTTFLLRWQIYVSTVATQPALEAELALQMEEYNAAPSLNPTYQNYTLENIGN